MMSLLFYATSTNGLEHPLKKAIKMKDKYQRRHLEYFSMILKEISYLKEIF